MKNELCSRWYCGVTYLQPDDLKVLLDNPYMFDKYIFIYHHSDSRSDGSFKDRHCHFIVQCRKVRDYDFVHQYFSGLDPFHRTLIERTSFDRLKSLLMYFLHIGEFKYQYPVHDLVYNSKDFFDKYIRALKCMRGDF